MSSYVDKEWFYHIEGRNIHLYKLLGPSGSDRISQSGVLRTRTKELMYPDEDIYNGLRIEHTSFDGTFSTEQYESRGYYSGTDVSFGQASSTSIQSSSNGFSFNGLHGNHLIKLRVRGSASNDGDYHINTTDVNHGAGRIITIDTGSTSTSLTSETAGNLVTIEQLPSTDHNDGVGPIISRTFDPTMDKNGNALFDIPQEDNYINLPRGLCLAVVDYCKAMQAEDRGDIDKKEYFMKEFYKKIGDNESNKRKVSMSFPASPFAVK